MGKVDSLPMEMLDRIFSVGCDLDHIYWNPPARIENYDAHDSFLHRLKPFLVASSRTCSTWRTRILSSQQYYVSKIVFGRPARSQDEYNGEATVLHHHTGPSYRTPDRLDDILQRAGEGFLDLAIGGEWICSPLVFHLIRDRASRIRTIDVQSHSARLMQSFIQNLITGPTFPNLITLLLSASTARRYYGPSEAASLVDEAAAISPPRLSVIEVSNIDLKVIRRSFDLAVSCLKVESDLGYMSMSTLWTSVIPTASPGLSRLTLRHENLLNESDVLALSTLHFPMLKELHISNISIKDMLTILGHQRFPILQILHLEQLLDPVAYTFDAEDRVTLSALHTFVLAANEYFAIHLCRAIRMPALVSFTCICTNITDFGLEPYPGPDPDILASDVEISCSRLQPSGSYALFQSVLFPRLANLTVVQEETSLFEGFSISAHARPILPELVHLKLIGEGSFLFFDHVQAAPKLKALEIRGDGIENIITAVKNSESRNPAEHGLSCRGPHSLTLGF